MRSPGLAALLVLAACGGSAPAAQPAPASAPSAAAPAEPRPGEPFVLDPGAAPRHRLRYRVPLGTRRASEMVFSMTVDFAGQSVVSPPFVMAGTVEVVDVGSDGSHLQQWACDRTEVRATPTTDPAVADALRDALRHLEGVIMRMPVGARGQTASVEWDGARLSPEQQQIIDNVSTTSKNLITVLPVEAIGIGARWTLADETTNNGVTIDVHTVMEVVDVDETSIRLRGTTDFMIPRQEMATVSGPIPLEGEGRGTTEATLDVTTLESTYVTRMNLAMRMDGGGGQVVPLDMTMDVRMALF